MKKEWLKLIHYLTVNLNLYKMKLDFNGYTYCNFDEKASNFTEEEKQKRAYNADTYKSFLDKHDYQGAADYLKNFHFNGEKAVEKNQWLENEIASLEWQDMDFKARWGRTPVQNQSAVEFAEVAMNPLALDKIAANGVDESGENTGNPYAKRFIELKKSLGGGNDVLEFEFYPKKQTFLGIDWLAKDNNDANIDVFLDSIGYTKEELRNNNIDVTDENGKTHIRFNKANKLSNNLIKAYTDIAISNGLINQFAPKLKGLDSKGNVIYEAGIRASNNGITNTDVYKIVDIKRILSDTNNIKTEFFYKPLNNDGVFSSTICNYLDDNLEKLNALKRAGRINEDDYQKAYSKYIPYVHDLLRSMSGMRMYTNDYNKNHGDKTLNPITSFQQSYLEQYISAQKPEDLILQGMVSDGEYGVLITIPAKEKTKNRSMDDTSEDKLESREVQVFVPGLLSTQIQASMNKDTKLFAVKTVNEMQKEGLEYRTRNGITIKSLGQGEFKVGDDNNSKDVIEVQKLINEDRIIRNAVRALKYEFLTIDDKLVDTANFDLMAKSIAIKGANEIDPETLLTLTDGTALTLDDIFNNRTVGGGYSQLGLLRDAGNSMVSNKIMRIYNIYDEIVKDMHKYLAMK